MTRPKADTDAWLLDPITRDRQVANSVVRGIRTIEVLLRGIRDDLDESRTLRAEVSALMERSAYNEARAEALLDLIEGSHSIAPEAKGRARELVRGRSAAFDFAPCEIAFCGLPSGHRDPHRPRQRARAQR